MNKVGLKSAKGTSTSGFVTRSRVNKQVNKQHRYLHESDMEDSDEEVTTPKVTKRQVDVQQLLNNNKKIKLNQNNHKVLINKYYNMFLDFIEDNDINLEDQRDHVLQTYRQKLTQHYEKSDGKELPLNHELCNYKRQVTLLTNNLDINVESKSRLKY